MSISWTTVTNLINLGTSPNSGDGDSVRLAFTKINNNFLTLFTATSTVSTATSTSTGVIKPGIGLTVAEDGTLSVTGESSTSTVHIIDAGGTPTIDIIAESGSFLLSNNTTTYVSLLSFDTTIYRSAMIDIIANDETANTFDQGLGYIVTWNDTSANVIGMSPISIKNDGTTKTALWDLKSAVVTGNTATVRLYNMQGNPPPLHTISWKAKVTLFRL